MRPRDGDESVDLITLSDNSDEKSDSTPFQLKDAGGPDNQVEYGSPRREIFFEELAPTRIKTPSLPATPVKKKSETELHKVSSNVDDDNVNEKKLRPFDKKVSTSLIPPEDKKSLATGGEMFATNRENSTRNKMGL